MAKRTKLMIPGPVDVWDETLDEAGKPITPHYGDEWIRLYWDTIGLIKRLYQTKNDIYIFVSSGSGALEAALSSTFRTGEKVALVDNGPFAGRTRAILKGCGIQMVAVQSEWGKAADVDKMRATLKEHGDIAGLAVVANDTGTAIRNPVKELAALAHEYDIPIYVDAISGMGGYHLPVDEWDLDLVITSSNKCLESLPGVGILSVSPRAWKLIDAKKEDRNHGWYFNLSVWKDEYVNDPVWGAWHPYPITMNCSTILALRTSLKRILDEETLEGHFGRFAWAQQMVRKGLGNIGFRMIATEQDASPTVTAIWKQDDMEVKEFLAFMEKEHGFMLADASGALAGKGFRISHMGKASTKEYLIPCLLGIEDFVRTEKGVDIPVGASLIGLGQGKPWY